MAPTSKILPPIPPQDHPIWRVINVVVIFLGVTLVLYVNANNFDATELRAIVQLILGVIAYEAFKHKKAIPESKKNIKDS